MNFSSTSAALHQGLKIPKGTSPHWLSSSTAFVFVGTSIIVQYEHNISQTIAGRFLLSLSFFDGDKTEAVSFFDLINAVERFTEFFGSQVLKDNEYSGNLQTRCTVHSRFRCSSDE